MFSTNKGIKFGLTLCFYVLVAVALFIVAIIGSMPLVAFGFFGVRIIWHSIPLWLSSNWFLFVVCCSLPLYLFMLFNLGMTAYEHEKAVKLKLETEDNNKAKEIKK